MVNIFDINANILALIVLFKYWCEVNNVNAKTASVNVVDKLMYLQQTGQKYDEALHRKLTNKYRKSNTIPKITKSLRLKLELKYTPGYFNIMTIFKSKTVKTEHTNFINDSKENWQNQLHSTTLRNTRNMIQYITRSPAEESNNKQKKAVSSIKPRADLEGNVINEVLDLAKMKAADNKSKPTDVKKMKVSKKRIQKRVVRQRGQRQDGEKRNEGNTTMKNMDTVDEYLSPYSIVPQMMRILENFKNANVSTETLGRTVEYNDIVLFKITELHNGSDATFRVSEGKYVDEAPVKKIIFIVHGLTVMGLSELSCLTEENKLKLLIEYYLEHLDKFDIFLIPIANPDGYVASRSKSGVFWNKNKSPQKDCSGVMLDRNFDVAWSSSNDLSSCSQAYPGPGPFSESETRAIRDVLHYHGHKIVAYIHVHAGTYDTNSFKGDAVLYPRGYTENQSDDDKYIDMRGEIDEAMKNASFQIISVSMDTLYNWYGKVTGTSVDYAATVYGIPYAMEFVMQLYANSLFASEDEDLVDYTALTQIWKRVINAAFISISRTFQLTNERVR